VMMLNSAMTLLGVIVGWTLGMAVMWAVDSWSERRRRLRTLEALVAWNRRCRDEHGIHTQVLQGSGKAWYDR
jgi:hypothetical protein